MIDVPSPPPRATGTEQVNAYLHQIGAFDLNGDRTTPPTLEQRMLSLTQLAALKPPMPLIQSVLDLDSLALVYGRRGSRKSFVAIDWTACVATGTRWHHRVVTRVPVIYVVGESTGGIHQRFDAWFQHHGVIASRPDWDMFRVLPEPLNLLNEKAVAEFAEVAENMHAGLIVFDTLARCIVGGDENSARDAGLVIEQLDLIRRATGACIAVIHHSGKDLTAGGRGSSVFEGNVDTVIEIGSTDDVVTIKCTKQKDHPEFNPITLRAVSVEGSAVLADHHASIAELTPAAMVALRCLHDVSVPGGVTSRVWKTAFCDESGQREASFYRHRNLLVILTLVSQLGEGNNARYQVNDEGLSQLSSHSQHSP